MPMPHSGLGRLLLRAPRMLACVSRRNALPLPCRELPLDLRRRFPVFCKQRDPGAGPRFLSFTRKQPCPQPSLQPGSPQRGMSLLRQRGPAFEVHFDRETWDCFTGEEALNEYLLSEQHVDVTSLPAPQFSQWLADFVIKQRKSCGIFRQRERIAGLLAEHAEEIQKLKDKVLAAQARFEALPCYDEYVESDASAKKLDAAINGMQKFLEGSGDFPEYLLRKVESATNRLIQAQADRDKITISQGLLLADHPEIKELHDCEAALEGYYVQIGLRDQQRDLDQLQQGASQGSRISGVSFESISTHALRGALTCSASRSSDTSIGSDGRLLSNNGCAAGECSSSLCSILGPPDDRTFLCILSNVTLKIGFGEIDKAIVKLKRPAPGPSGPAAQQSVGGAPKTAGRGRCWSEGDILVPSDLKGHHEVMEVVAVVECKRNCNDLAYGFFQYQKILAWLTGDVSAYSPDEMRTNFHASGHFEKPTKHCEDDVTFTFRPDSFRRFSRDEASTYFLDRLFLVAFLGPSEGSLCGLDSSAMAMLKHRLATNPALIRALEMDPPDLEAATKTQEWLAQHCKAPTPTSNMLRLYLQSKLLSNHILLLSKASTNA